MLSERRDRRWQRLTSDDSFLEVMKTIMNLRHRRSLPKIQQEGPHKTMTIFIQKNRIEIIPMQRWKAHTLQRNQYTFDMIAITDFAFLPVSCSGRQHVQNVKFRGQTRGRGQPNRSTYNRDRRGRQRSATQRQRPCRAGKGKQ